MNHEIHEAHEKSETLADIRKEVEGRFRKLCIEHVNDIGHLQAMQEFNHVFDRIEAAWKRERGEIEQRAIDHTTAHMDAVHRDNCRDCVCRTPVGNSAAMRDALENANEHAGKIMAITTIPELYAKSLEVIRHHAVEIGFIAAETLAEGDDNASK